MKKLLAIFLVATVYLFSSNAWAQISTYCTSGANFSSDSKIDSVSLNTIHKSSPPSTCEKYTDNTNLSTTLQQGQTYTITVKHGTCGNYYKNYQRVWIDFNQDGIFQDPGERILDTSTSSSLQISSQSFTVPALSPNGPTFMRVVSSEASNPSPCNSFSWGETEDYGIYLFSYCSSGATSSANSKIDSVSLNTLQVGSSPTACETYTQNFGLTTTLEQGQSYNLTVKHGTCGSYVTNYQRAWIDFDQNGTFDDPSERVFDTVTNSTGQLSTQSFSVPSVPNGKTYIRVVSSETSNPSPCGTYANGETEDYSIELFTYCTSNASFSGDSKIDSVGLNTLHKSSVPTACETYTDNTNLSTNLGTGATYTISVKHGTCFGYYTNYQRAWIDFNQDGVFQDPAERIIDASTSSSLQVNSNTFTVPSGSVAGTTRMRVVSSEDPNPSPCGTYDYGETEDYSINIFIYCASYATNTFDTKIDSVGLNQLHQPSSPTTCETYTDYLNVSTVLGRGNPYTLTVKNGSCGSYYTMDKRAWIDFDQNGVFDDPAERIMDTTSTAALQAQSSSFIVPANAMLGITRMRVIGDESGPSDPCGSYSYGETEDYTIEIIDCALPTIDSVVSASVCGSDSMVLGAIASSGEISWYSSATGGTMLDTGSTFATPVLSSTTTYYVSTSNFCGSSARTPVVATVNTIPVLSNLSGNTRCDSGTVAVSAASSAGTIYWYTSAFNTIPIDSGTSVNTLVFHQTGWYYVDATDSNNCTSVRDSVMIIVNNSSTSSITLTSCYAILSPSGMYTYTTSGTYSDTLVNSVGCDSIITINLTIPVINVSVTQNSAELTANATGSTYQWLECESGGYTIISGETSKVFTATVNGEYAVEVTTGSCTDTSSCIAVNSVGIAAKNSGSDINVYPNPTTGELNINLGSVQSNTDVSLINIQGQVLKTWRFEEASEVSIDIEEVKGVYLLNVISSGQKRVFQIIKE